MASYFPRWHLRRTTDQVQLIGTGERLPWLQTFAMGVQHVVAMFGATVLAPLLMGFDPNVAILMSGVGTLLFFLFVGGRLPSYLGSSFSFIGLVIAITAYSGTGLNPHLGIALGGIVACGFVYMLIGLLVMLIGTRWIEILMPPVVTGAVVAVIGLNLAPVAVKGVNAHSFDAWMALATVLCVGGVAVFARGMLQRLLILVGLIFAYGIYVLLANGAGIGPAINFTVMREAAWFGIPHFSAPVFKMEAMVLVAPIAIILVAENLGHIKAVAAMTGQNFDPYIGRAFVGDGVATMLSGSVGGTGVTTYAENIGVMAATKIYSTLVFVVAACLAIILGFSPKFGALIHTIPPALLGGVSIVVFGLITVSGIRIWIENKVDFSHNRNLLVAAVPLILGTGDFTLKFGQFSLGGIGCATFAAIFLHAFFGQKQVRSKV